MFLVRNADDRRVILKTIRLKYWHRQEEAKVRLPTNNQVVAPFVFEKAKAKIVPSQVLLEPSALRFLLLLTEIEKCRLVDSRLT